MNLKFAEPWWTRPQQRVFHVAINGSTVLSNFDIVGQAGAANTAIDKSFPVAVTNGTITIQFTSVIDHALVNAIEITPVVPATRVNMGGPAYMDAAGQAWTAGPCVAGSSPFSIGSTITGTTTPALYQTLCYGNSFQYQFTVPNATYKVNLKFAEVWWTQANKRVFNVAINGTTVLSNFDIVARTGAINIALDQAFTVPVTNGQISIQFTSVVDNASINAIELIPQ